MWGGGVVGYVDEEHGELSSLVGLARLFAWYKADCARRLAESGVWSVEDFAEPIGLVAPRAIRVDIEVPG